jgi:hypothetical protein
MGEQSWTSYIYGTRVYWGMYEGEGGLSSFTETCGQDDKRRPGQEIKAYQGTDDVFLNTLE